MKHELLFLGKTKERYIEAGITDYVARLSHYTDIETRVIKDKKNKHAGTDQESRQLMQAVAKGALIVALDSRGKQYVSEDFANLVSGWEMRGVKRVSYLIGGPDGLAPEIVSSADIVLSLSRMTFTHDMVRMLLMEQLYRAYTIKAGERYHR